MNFNTNMLTWKPTNGLISPPYAVMQGVLIQDFQNSISFGWVECHVKQNKNRMYEIAGLQGGNGNKPIKCYMIIPFPFDDYTGWNFVFDDNEITPKKNKPYIVAIEDKSGRCTTYELAISHYIPGKYSDWDGYDFKECSKAVIAWREMPCPKKGR